MDLPVAATGIDTARFNAKIESCFAAYADNPSLKRLRNNEQLTAADIQELERILVDSGVAETGTIESVAEQAGGLGLFLRSILGLERSAVEREFAKFLNRSEFSVEQVRFVGLIVDELSHNGVVNPERLFESPYTDTALRGPQQLFGDQVFPRDYCQADGDQAEGHSLLASLGLTRPAYRLAKASRRLESPRDDDDVLGTHTCFGAGVLEGLAGGFHADDGDAEAFEDA